MSSVIDTLNEKLRERTEALTQYSRDLETARACIQQLQKQVEGLKARIVSGLETFGSHADWCRVSFPGEDCTCGFSALLDAARKEAE